MATPSFQVRGGECKHSPTRVFTGPLATFSLSFQDAHSQQHLNIIKYFVAEGVACGQVRQWVGGWVGG